MSTLRSAGVLALLLVSGAVAPAAAVPLGEGENADTASLAPSQPPPRSLHVYGPRRSASVDHAEAVRRLAQARRVREAGRIPLGREAAVDDAYARRQARLDAALSAAEARSCETSAAARRHVEAGRGLSLARGTAAGR